MANTGCSIWLRFAFQMSQLINDHYYSTELSSFSGVFCVLRFASFCSFLLLQIFQTNTFCSMRWSRSIWIVCKAHGEYIYMPYAVPMPWDSGEVKYAHLILIVLQLGIGIIANRRGNPVNKMSRTTNDVEKLLLNFWQLTIQVLYHLYTQ